MPEPLQGAWVWHPALEVSDDLAKNPFEGTAVQLPGELRLLMADPVVPLERLTASTAHLLARSRIMIPADSADAAARGLLRRPSVTVSSPGYGPGDVLSPWGFIGAGVLSSTPGLGRDGAVEALRRGLARRLVLSTSPGTWSWDGRGRDQGVLTPVVDEGDLVVHPRTDSSSDVLNRLAAAVDSTVLQGRRPLVVGGDHVVAYPTIRTMVRHWPDLVVVHLDAHADRRRLVDPRVPPDAGDFVTWCLTDMPSTRWITIGVRGLDGDFDDSVGDDVHYLTAHEIITDHSLDSLVALLRGRPVHITLDIDVLDPSVAPQVAFPVFGGLALDDLTRTIDVVVAHAHLVGLDISELCGPFDRQNLAGMAAVNILHKILRDERQSAHGES